METLTCFKRKNIAERLPVCWLGFCWLFCVYTLANTLKLKVQDVGSLGLQWGTLPWNYFHSTKIHSHHDWKSRWRHEFYLSCSHSLSTLGVAGYLGEMEERSWEYTDMNTRQPGVSRTFSVHKTLSLASVTPVWRITEFLESLLFPGVAWVSIIFVLNFRWTKCDHQRHRLTWEDSILVYFFTVVF